MSTATSIIAFIISIAIVIALYIFILPDEKRSTLNKGFQMVHDFLKIKKLMIESIFRFVYVLAVVSSVVEGILMIFSDPGKAILLIIFGPIVSRIVFEFLLLGVVLVKNVMEINNHLKGIDTPSDNGFGINAESVLSDVGKKIQNMTTVQKTEDSGKTCSKCGKPIPQGSAFCIHCGTPVE